MKAFVSLLVSLMLCLCVSGTMADAGAMVYEEGDFEYSVSDDKATIKWYWGIEADVVVPETLGGIR